MAARRRDVIRAIGELRRGDPVVLHDNHTSALVFAAESLDEAQLTQARALTTAGLSLITTSWRAAAIGANAQSATAALKADYRCGAVRRGAETC